MKRRSRLLQERIADRVVVTLKTGESFAGVLWDADDKLWILRSARALGAGQDGSDIPIDGEVLVLSDDVLYAQRP